MTFRKHQAIEMSCSCDVRILGRVRDTGALQRAKDFFITLHPSSGGHEAFFNEYLTTDDSLPLLTPNLVRRARKPLSKLRSRDTTKGS